MDIQQYKQIENRFWPYVDSFEGQDDFVKANLELKRVHTRGVCHEMGLLTDALHLCENDKIIALTIALLHDTARFEQFVKFRTFSDAKSFNHSLRGVEILRENNVLNDIDDEETRIIEKAISCHGAKEICPKCDSRTLPFAKLIRDADKIDIFRVVAQNYLEYETRPEGFVQDLPSDDPFGYTPSVLQAVFDRRTINYSELQTINDAKLLQIGWIFDINYPQSLARMRQAGHIDSIIDLLPDEESLRKVAGYVRGYMDDQIAKINK